MLQGALGGLSGAAEKLLGPIKSLATSIPFVGAAFAAVPISGAGFMAFLQEGMNRVAQMGKQADMLGISTQKLAGLKLLAGPAGTDAMVAGLGHMAKLLGEVNAGSKEARNGIESLGLDSMQLASVSFEQALGLVANRIQELPSITDKAAVSFQLFGRHAGQEMLSLLMKGAAGIEAATQKAKEMGLSFSAIDAQQVRMAQKAIGETGLAIQGLQTQLAIQLAPFIKAAADRFNEMAVNSKDMSRTVSSAIEGITTGIGYLLDGIHAVGTGWKYVELAFNASAQAMALGLSKLLDLASHLPGAMGQALKEQAELARAISDQFGAGVNDLNNQIHDRSLDPSAAGAVHKFFDDIRAKALAAAEAARKTKGGIDSLADSAEKAALKTRGQQRMEGLLSPLEQFEKTMHDINAEVMAGAYGMETMGKAAQEAFDKLNKSAGLGDVGLPQLVEKGSQAAFAMLHSGDGRRQRNPADVIDELKQQEAANASSRDALLRQIFDKLNFSVVSLGHH